jgi:hypothetical protein
MKKFLSHQQNEFQQTSRELKRCPHRRQPHQQTPELIHIPLAMIHPAPKETAWSGRNKRRAMSNLQQNEALQMWNLENNLLPNPKSPNKRKTKKQLEEPLL